MAIRTSRMKRIIAGMLSVTTIMSSVIISTPAAGAEETQSGTTTDSSVSSIEIAGIDGKYSKYYNDYLNQGVAKPDKEITIYASDYTGGTIDGEAFQKGSTDEAITSAVETIKENNGFQNLKNFLAENTELEATTLDAIKWKNDKLTLTYKFTVAETGLYNLEAIYYPISGKETSNTVLDIGLKLDGEYPFTAAKDLTLDRYWKDESEIKRDGKDNDLRPGQITYDCWVKYPIKDKEGLYNDPYFFYLEKGEHTLEIEGIRTYGVFHSFTFKNYDELPSYESLKPSEDEIQNTPALTSKNEELGTNTIFLQAEEPLYKTASTLYATYDRTTYMTNPSHPTKQRYNTVGQATWNKSTQSITYSFKVENDGYYRFNFKARQNQMRGFFSNRRIYIDGNLVADLWGENRFNDRLVPFSYEAGRKSAVRIEHIKNQLYSRAFARTVFTDKTHYASARQREADILQLKSTLVLFT